MLTRAISKDSKARVRVEGVIVIIIIIIELEWPTLIYCKVPVLFDGAVLVRYEPLFTEVSIERVDNFCGNLASHLVVEVSKGGIVRVVLYSPNTGWVEIGAILPLS